MRTAQIYSLKAVSAWRPLVELVISHSEICLHNRKDDYMLHRHYMHVRAQERSTLEKIHDIIDRINVGHFCVLQKCWIFHLICWRITFLYVQFSIVHSDEAALMVWLGLPGSLAQNTLQEIVPACLKKYLHNFPTVSSKMQPMQPAKLSPKLWLFSLLPTASYLEAQPFRFNTTTTIPSSSELSSYACVKHTNVFSVVCRNL